MEPGKLEIIRDFDHFKTLLSIFFFQNEKKSYPSEIVRYGFRVFFEEDVTKTKEYKRCLKSLLALESEGLIEKVKPPKPGEFKTHFKINLKEFTRLLLYYIKELPTYDAQIEMTYNPRDFENNPYIQGLIGMYFRGMACEYLLVRKDRSEEWNVFYESLNLREAFFLLLNRGISHYHRPWVRIEDNPFSEKIGAEAYCMEIAGKKYTFEAIEAFKKKPKIGKFLDFLAVLGVLSQQLSPFSKLNGTIYDAGDFIGTLLGEERWKGESVKEIIKDPEKVFSFYPTE